MNYEELAQIVADLSAAGNLCPFYVLQHITRLLGGEDPRTRDKIYRETHKALFKMRQSLP